MSTKKTNTGAAVVASEKITEAVNAFAKYREASYKSREASREATQKHYQELRDDVRGNKELYNAMVKASREEEKAWLACSFCREIVRGMLEAETVKAYGEIIGGFVGKFAGPKTCRKLYNAISERLELRGFRGVSVWFCSPLYGGRLSRVEVSAEGLNGSENVTIYGKYGDNGGGDELTDKQNRFNGRPLNGGKFEADERTPEQFAAEFIAAEEELEKMRKDYDAKRKEIEQRVRVGAVRPRSWHTVEDQRNA